MKRVSLLLAASCWLSAVSAQWLETSIPLPDTFGGLRMPTCMVYDSANNAVFVAGESTRAIFVLDAHDGRRLARIPFEGDVRALCYSSVSNKVFASAYDQFVAVIDAGTMRIIDTVQVDDSPGALVYNPAMDRVYCASPFGRSVNVIDCGNDVVLATVTVGQQPSSLCWNPNRNVVYSANCGSNTVSIINAATNAVVDTIPVGSLPVAFVYNPDLDKLYTANYGSGTVTVIDGLADSVLATISAGEFPLRLCYNPVNSRVYVADENEDLGVIDCESDTIMGYGEANGSLDVVYNQWTNHVYATNGRYVVVMDSTGEDVEYIHVGDHVCALSVADSGRRVFGVADEEALVGVIDCTSDSLCGIVATDPHLQLNAVCFNPTTDRAYCAVAGANAVMVIDGVDNSIRAVLPARAEPKALLHNPLGNKVYCASASTAITPSTITVIDGAGDSVLATIETGTSVPYGLYPNVLCLNAAGDRLYGVQFSSNAVLVLDVTADTVICKVQLDELPYGVCYESTHDYVYVRTSRAVDVIDAELNLMIAQVDVGYGAFALLYVPVGAKVYTPDGFDGTVSVVAGERPELIAQIDVSGTPTALCWDSKNNKVYCGCRDSNRVAVIDAAADTITALVAVGIEPWALSYDSVNNCVYCACRGDSSVAVIDCESDSVITTIGVGTEPIALAWNPLDMRTYVANLEGYSVSVIRDSLRVGIGEVMSDECGMMNVGPTVIHGILNLEVDCRQQAVGSAELLDAAGRLVMPLRPGANDVRHLAHGVYFVLEPGTMNRELKTKTTKVVITR